MQNVFTEFVQGKLSSIIEEFQGGGNTSNFKIESIHWFIRTEHNTVDEVKVCINFSQGNNDVLDMYDLGGRLGKCDMFTDDYLAITLMFFDYPKVDERVLDESCLMYNDEYFVWMYTVSMQDTHKNKTK